MFINTSLVQFKNISSISLIFDILKFEKSNICNDSQPLNIAFIYLTFDVLKLDIFIEDKDLQS